MMRLELIFPIAIGVIVVLSLLYRVAKYGGVRGALLGARSDRTIGELDLGRRALLRTRLRVHRLDVDGADQPRIMLEVVRMTFMAYQTSPIALRTEDATMLRDLLARAAEER
jgi:hypothetical protein